MRDANGTEYSCYIPLPEGAEEASGSGGAEVRRGRLRHGACLEAGGAAQAVQGSTQ